jgi:cyanophycinase
MNQPMKHLCLWALLTLPVVAEKLVIVGGGEHPPMAMRQFYEWAGQEQARMLYIPWATSEPEENLKEVAKDFPVGTVLVMAPKDKAALLQELDKCTAVWFSGGDQIKVMKVLEDGEILQRLRQKYASGCVFGGTSAGCAIMSSRMITGEGDFTLLDGRAVEVKPGLGLLPERVIVDQHFLKRQRQNRLFGLVLMHPDSLGIGIDEDSALILEDQDKARVAGRSPLMMVTRLGDQSLKIDLVSQPFRLSEFK